MSKPSWHRTCEKLIVRHIIGPIIVPLMQSGVESKADLKASLESHLNGTVTGVEFDRWLKVLNLDKVFTARRLYTISPAVADRVPLQKTVEATGLAVDTEPEEPTVPHSSGGPPPPQPMPAQNISKDGVNVTVAPPFA